MTGEELRRVSLAARGQSTKLSDNGASVTIDERADGSLSITVKARGQRGGLRHVGIVIEPAEAQALLTAVRTPGGMS